MNPNAKTFVSYREKYEDLLKKFESFERKQQNEKKQYKQNKKQKADKLIDKDRIITELEERLTSSRQLNVTNMLKIESLEAEIARLKIITNELDMVNLLLETEVKQTVTSRPPPGFSGPIWPNLPSRSLPVFLNMRGNNNG